MTRLLVVDDDEQGQMLTRRALRDEGYDLIFAGSIAEAMSAPGPFDGLLVDERLPDGSGQWVAGHHPGVPVLYLSGMPEVEPALVKPFSFEQLRDAVRGMLR